jgi:hypothetical protein
MDSNGRCDTGCVPGRKGCDCNLDPQTCVGRFFCGLYECLCCPDPCYDPPKWLGVADSAFFLDAARPITQMRIRVDSAWDFKNPDRAEYVFAREMTPQIQQIATCRGPNIPGKGPTCISKTIDYQELTMYNEASTGRVGVFVELPYRDVDFNNPGAVNQATCCSQSQFADMNVGTKTLLLDCELLQLSFQFKTFIPIGSGGKGMGTEHVSLEPALLLNLKLSSSTYLQAESAYWIPIAGDPIYEANIWHNHVSLNHILCCPCKDFQVIGTAELNEWHVYGGAYTIPDYTLNGNFLAASATSTMLSGGPGIRGILCDKYDLGVGGLFAFTGSRWAKDLLRVEFRWRF